MSLYGQFAILFSLSAYYNFTHYLGENHHGPEQL